MLAAAGQAVGIRCPRVEPELFLVADEGMAEVLGRQGIPRGRCWTPEEIDLMKSLSVSARQTVAIAKVEFDGVAEDVVP